MPLGFGAVAWLIWGDLKRLFECRFETLERAVLLLGHQHFEFETTGLRITYPDRTARSTYGLIVCSLDIPHRTTIQAVAPPAGSLGN